MQPLPANGQMPLSARRETANVTRGQPPTETERAYVAPMLGIHFTWRVKRDVSEPLTYAIVLGTFLLVRVVASLRSRLSASATA